MKTKHFLKSQLKIARKSIGLALLILLFLAPCNDAKASYTPENFTLVGHGTIKREYFAVMQAVQTHLTLLALKHF